ncbi:hypothetical protein EON65_37870 [archaeon]|nr:MAG: hypothetical protein EON65_37870 [archaeon]
MQSQDTLPFFSIDVHPSFDIHMARSSTAPCSARMPFFEEATEVIAVASLSYVARFSVRKIDSARTLSSL